MFVWKSCLSGHTVTGPGDQKLLSCVRPSALPPYWTSLTETAWPGAQGTTGQASTVRGTELPTYAEQREEKTHRKDGPERHKLPQERSAKCTRGQMWQQSI